MGVTRFQILEKPMRSAVGMIVLFLLSCDDSGVNVLDSSSDLGYGQVSVDMINAVLKPDGKVWTWGTNYTGALGNGTTEDSDVPKEIPNLKNVVSVDQSYGAVVAVDRTGDIWFWGNLWIYEGPIDVDTNVVLPVKIAHLSMTNTVTLLRHLVFALRDDGTVWRMTLDAYSPKVLAGPTEVAGTGPVKAISKNLAVTNDGRLYNLGDNSFLQTSLTGVVSAARGVNHSLILDQGGSIWAWGNNELGQLGNGTLTNSDLPVKVANFAEANSISASYNLGLAIVGGNVWLWGFGGQQGDTAIKRNLPIQVKGLSNVVLASVGMKSLVMEADGTYWEFKFDEAIPKQVPFR
jgi:alpha-tubulin suppressor-like RCC1 family protein